MTAISAAHRRAQLEAMQLTLGARRFALWAESAYPAGECLATQAELGERYGLSERQVRRLETELVRLGAWQVAPARAGARRRVRRWSQAPGPRAALSGAAKRYLAWLEHAYPEGRVEASAAELAAAWGGSRRRLLELEAELIDRGVLERREGRARPERRLTWPERAATLRERLERAAQGSGEGTDHGPATVRSTGPADVLPAAAAHPFVIYASGSAGVQGSARSRGELRHPHRTSPPAGTPAGVRSSHPHRTSAAPSPVTTRTLGGPLPPHTPPTQLAAAGLSNLSSGRAREAPAPAPQPSAAAEPASGSWAAWLEAEGHLAPPAASPPVPTHPRPEEPPGGAGGPRPISLTAQALLAESSDLGLAARSLARLGLAGDGALEVLAGLAERARCLGHLRALASSAADVALTRAEETPAGWVLAGIRGGWLAGRLEPSLRDPGGPQGPGPGARGQSWLGLEAGFEPLVHARGEESGRKNLDGGNERGGWGARGEAKPPKGRRRSGRARRRERGRRGDRGQGRLPFGRADLLEQIAEIRRRDREIAEAEARAAAGGSA